MAAADRQHGYIAVEGAHDVRQLHPVAVGRDFLDPGMPLRAVDRRVDVNSARQHQRIKRGRELIDARRGGLVEIDHFAARVEDASPVAVGRFAGHVFPSCDADPGPRWHVSITF